MTRSPRADRRAVLEEELLAALERRTADGTPFASIRVDDLTRDVGISRSKFYVHFESKSDLLRAWIARFLQTLEDDATWWARSADFTREDLRASLARLAERYREQAVLLRACHELAAQEGPARQAFESSFARTHRALRGHIRTGQRHGWINPELDPGGAAVWLTSMMERGLSDVVAPARPREMAQVVDACTQIVWLTLYSPPTGRRADAAKDRRRERPGGRT